MSIVKEVNKFIIKYKTIVLFVLIVLLGYVLLKNKLEMFAISAIKVKDINNGLDSIIACEKSGKTCSKDIISDFQSFKKYLGYPNFDVILYDKLINGRKKKGVHITLDEIKHFVETGKYESSFDTTQKVIEKMEGDTLPAALANIDPNTEAGQCVQSLKALQEWMEAKQKENEAAYQAAMTDWRNRKAAVIAEIKNSPSKWVSFCSEYPATCKENITSMFRRFAGEQSGWDKRSFPNLSNDDCALECIKDPINCHFYVSSNDGRCWLKSGNNATNVHMVYKTNTGMSWRTNNQLSGNNITSFPFKTAAGCAAECEANPICSYAESKTMWWDGVPKQTPWGMTGPDTNQCNLKQMTENANRTTTGIPNTRADDNFILSDNHPYIQDKVGPAPRRSDFPFPTPPAILCQDCRVAAKDISISESTQAVVEQVQNCIMNKAQEEAQAKAQAEAQAKQQAEANTGTQSDSQTNSDSQAKADDQTSAQDTSTSTFDANKGLIIGLSVGGLVLVIICIVVIMLYRRRSN